MGDGVEERPDIKVYYPVLSPAPLPMYRQRRGSQPGR